MVATREGFGRRDRNDSLYESDLDHAGKVKIAAISPVPFKRDETRSSGSSIDTIPDLEHVADH
jgi:hypothetical protein